ncbi:MAG: hypothetical protein ABIQ99_14520 [Thermoflexales bacterium]
MPGGDAARLEQTGDAETGHPFMPERIRQFGRAGIGVLEESVDPLDEGIRRIQGGPNAGQGRRDVVAPVRISGNLGHERAVLNLLGGDFPVEQLHLRDIADVGDQLPVQIGQPGSDFGPLGLCRGDPGPERRQRGGERRGVLLREQVALGGQRLVSEPIQRT